MLKITPSHLASSMRKNVADRKHSSSSRLVKASYFINPDCPSDIKRKETDDSHVVLTQQDSNCNHYQQWDSENYSPVKSFLYSFPTGIEQFDFHDNAYHEKLANAEIPSSSSLYISSIDELPKRWAQDGNKHKLNQQKHKEHKKSLMSANLHVLDASGAIKRVKFNYFS